ncbi:MAG: RNA chaperone Hfq [Phycisphaerales bacterium]|nr:RNA chaperone Hfq [Phycisphaerales bacterium]
MSAKPTNVQETLLNWCRREQARCIVYLVNGVQLRGVVTAFDNFTILLEDEGKQQMVYKHAVTTVQPLRRLPDLLAPAEAPEAPPAAPAED